MFQTNVGPILLCMNSYKDVGNSMTLTSMRGATLDLKLHKVILDAVRQQTESGYPQAIILSGKCYNSPISVTIYYFITPVFVRYSNFRVPRRERLWKNVRFDVTTKAVIWRGRRWSRDGRIQTFSRRVHRFEIVGVRQNIFKFRI